MSHSSLSRPLPDLEYLRQCLSYDPDTGILTWLHRPASHFDTPHKHRIFLARWAGKPAGSLVQGYLDVGLQGRRYKAHRIAWLLYYGEDPLLAIDHINRIKSDNRIINLRTASASDNGHNQSLSARNTSGICGVSWSEKSGKWYAQVGHQGRTIPLGLYLDITDAILARLRANETLGFTPGHGHEDPNRPWVTSTERLHRDNTSGVRGVYRTKRDGKWMAYIFAHGKKTHLGSYPTLEEAATARKAAEISYGVADRVLRGRGDPILKPSTSQ